MWPESGLSPMATKTTWIGRMSFRVLLAHNYYQRPGGEDAVFESESKLLESRGHYVHRLTRHNREVETTSQVRLASAAVWNHSVFSEVRDIIKTEGIDIVHVHNTLPVISPSIYHAARVAGAGIVQTLHNFRLLCPQAQFYRDGQVCEKCLGRRVAYPSIRHGCYRDSSAASAVVATMLLAHHLLGTWRNKVDVFIALTDFARSKFVMGGFPKSKFFLKPNFLWDSPSVGSHTGNYALFVGRLSSEKGLSTLLSAWADTDTLPELKVVGDGPMAPTVAEYADGNGRVSYLGQRAREDVLALMREARFLVVPSEWYEGFPMTIVEAFGVGLPVVASRIGGLASIIEDGRNGLLFEAGNCESLRCVAVEAHQNDHRLAILGEHARTDFDKKYSAGPNYEMLMQAYDLAMRRSNIRGSVEDAPLVGQDSLLR